MAGPLDWLFGGPTPAPARPTSRGATFGAGYQGMPASTNIEDRRSTPDLGYLPSRPHDLNWNSTNNYNKFDPGSFSRQFDAEQEARKWANANMPQTLSTAPLQDPNSSLDPSVMANVKAWQDRMFRAYPPGWQGPELPDGSQRGPQAIGTTLNYAPPGSL